MKSVLTVTLNPALDQFILESKKTLSFAGGKGINVSRALACLKTPTFITGIVGGEVGGILQKLLEREGLDFDFLEVSYETRTNLTFVNKNKTKRSISQGAIVSEDIGEQFLDKYAELLPKASVVVISGRFLPGLPISLIYELIILAKKKKIPVIVDTHGPALKEALKAKPDMLKINQEELKELLGLTKLNEKDIMRAIVQLHERGLKFILISLGAKGAIGFDGRTCWKITPPILENKYSVGSGDSMLAGFIYSYIKADDFLQSCVWATASGTANIKYIMPGSIKLKDIKKIIKSIKTKRISK